MHHRYAISKGVRIFYRERGTGEPLLLIMGFGADGSLWDKHASEYDKYFRCIIPDNRGVGLSDQPTGPYSTSIMADDMIAVMDEAGVQRARVVGISMGGAIAQQMAINYPGRVVSLVLVSTWARFNNYAKAVYENLKHIRSVTAGSYFTELLQLWIFAPPFYESHRTELAADAAGAESVVDGQSRDGFEGQLDACITHDTLGRLNQIVAPTLITVGGKDIFTPPDFSRDIHENIRGSMLTAYEDGGHAHHWEDLQRFNKESLDFLLSN